MPNRLLSAPAPSVIQGFALIAALATALVLVPAGGAFAHAELESSDPKDGASLTARPAEVTLTFAEEIDARTARSRVTVVGDDAAEYSYDPEPAVNGEAVVVPLEPVTGGGEYTVTYRVVSEDAHPVEGSVRFTVVAGEGPSEPTATEPTGESGVDPVTDPGAAATATGPATTAPATDAPESGVDGQAGTVYPTWFLVIGGLAALLAGGTALVLVTRRRAP